MNHLLGIIGACVSSFVVCFTMWYLALRRTIALQRKEKKLLIFLVVIEELLPFIVIGNFIMFDGVWEKIIIAVCSGLGAGLGAWLLTKLDKKQ